MIDEKMILEHLAMKKKFFGKCFLIGLVLLLISFGLIVGAKTWVMTMGNSLYGLTGMETMRMAVLLLGMFKILIITFFFIPFLALFFMSKCKCMPKCECGAEKKI